MQSRTLLVFFLCLMLISLACLSTSEIFVTYPADTPTSVKTLAPVVSPSPHATQSPSSLDGDASQWTGNECAVISADEALHLRIGAGVTSQVLAFMKRGEVVKLISSTNAEWWLIKRGDLVGYARSKYLVKSEC